MKEKKIEFQYNLYRTIISMYVTTTSYFNMKMLLCYGMLGSTT